jgi:Tfp pilus assembly protein PilN
MKAINLLPPDLRGTPKGAAPKGPATAEEPGGIGALVVLGALAACVVALAAYVLTTNTVKDRQAKLDAAIAEARSTTERVSQLKPYADFQALAETRIQTVKDLASSRFDWEQALRDISRAVPADVTLTELNGSVGSAAGGGSSVRSAIAAPAIELKGCTAGQKEVATLLARLRAVEGVTRVSLSKSLKPAVTPGGVAPVSAGTGATATPCTGKRPPQFELVMFFERSKVPATVQDVTVTGGARPAAGGQAQSGTTESSAGATTPPADPAQSGSGAPTSTSAPQGGGS